MSSARETFLAAARFALGGQKEAFMLRSTIMVALMSALVLGSSIAAADPGRGRGPGMRAQAGKTPHGWTNGLPPGFSSPGRKQGWVNDRPPGWSKGKKKGWRGGTTPPGWRGRR
jgi:hypothetical protein